jgi:cardiolipin synthase C
MSLVLATVALLPATSRSDVLRILKNDQEAAQARIDLIQRAQIEIDVDYFSINDDEFACGFLGLLRDAARRGIKVRIVVDALNNHIPGPMQEHLLADGVEIREYHPFDPCRPLWLNRRLHDKILLIDGCQMIVGSRNLDERNFGLGEKNFVDRDVYVRGHAAWEAYEYFRCLWSSEHVRPTNTTELPKVRDLCPLPGAGCSEPCPACTLDRALGRWSSSCMVHTDVNCDWAEGCPEIAKVCFLHDDCGRKKEPGAISGKILNYVANARDSIILESPYLLVSNHLDEALAQAQARGVHVVILTNSLASTDQVLVYAGYSNQKKKLLARGIEIWEFAGPKHLHAKSALIDGCVSIIGSYNFDPRSEHLNTETAVVSCDPGVADQLIASMAENFGNSWQIGPDGKPINSKVRHPGADKKKLSQLHGARIIASIIKRHL